MAGNQSNGRRPSVNARGGASRRGTATRQSASTGRSSATRRTAATGRTASSGRNSETGRSSTTRRTTTTRRQTASRGDYRYQNIVTSPYGPQIGAVSLWDRIRRPLALLAVIAVLALIVFFAANSIGSCSPADDGKVHITVAEAQELSYTPNASDLQTIPTSSEVITASFADGDSGFSVSPSSLTRVNAAIAQIEKLGPCGFVFMDLQTGRALARNATEAMYCASSVKVFLAYYVMSSTSADDLSDEDYDDISEAILWSDNDSYVDLCERHFDDGYRAWLDAHGVDHYEGEGYYPVMNARTMASLWIEVYQWLQAGSESARQLASLLGETNESYIRDGLVGTGATVLNKAGWITLEDTKAVVDAGVISIGGRDYLMAILTGQPDWPDEALPNVARLARALYDIRGLLTSHITIEL